MPLNIHPLSDYRGESAMNLHQWRPIAARLLASTVMLVLPALAVAGTTTAFVPTGVVLYQPMVGPASAEEPGTVYGIPGALIPIPPPQAGLDSTCPDQSFVFIGYGDMYSSVLSAMLAGHKVSFGTFGCDPYSSHYPQVYAVTIY
jgi:hypothetical protein